ADVMRMASANAGWLLTIGLIGLIALHIWLFRAIRRASSRLTICIAPGAADASKSQRAGRGVA
ncbi:MAG: hypothetical protein HC927_11710, partial [Deltaproteobacteria bacterium]|nr:hypothetical protein [Deltaproteobacteria bacterium]